MGRQTIVNPRAIRRALHERVELHGSEVRYRVRGQREQRAHVLILRNGLLELHADRLPRLARGSLVRLRVEECKSIAPFFAEVQQQSSAVRARLRPPTVLEVQSRRSDKRVPHPELEVRVDVDGHARRIVVMDISGTGIGILASPMDWSPGVGQSVTAHFCRSGRVFPCVLQVARIDAAPATGLNRIGCRFVRAPAGEIEWLAAELGLVRAA